MKVGRSAGIVAACYAVTSWSYIVVSGKVAAGIAASVGDLQALETAKGIGFVSVTTLACFLLTYGFGRRIERQRDAISAAERRATAGLFASSVAHDFNNVLQVIGGHLELAEAQPDVPQSVRDNIQAIRRATDQGTALAKRLSKASGGAPLTDRTEVDLARVVAECVELVRGHRKSRAVHLEVDAALGLRVLMSESAARQIVTNLVLNAVEASPEGTVRVRLSESGGAAVLEVEDDGPGIPESARRHVFDAFITTKVDGTGLGLYATRTAVEQQDGAIDLSDSDLGGARFTVILPGALLEPVGAT